MKEEDAPLPVTASRILFYQAEDGTSRIEVRLDKGTVWLRRSSSPSSFRPRNKISASISGIFSRRENCTLVQLSRNT